MEIVNGIKVQCYDTENREKYMPLYRYNIVLDRKVSYFYPNGEVSIRNLGLELDEKGELYQEPYTLCLMGSHLGRKVKFCNLPELIQNTVLNLLPQGVD